MLTVFVLFVVYANFAFAYPSQGQRTQNQITGTSFQMPSINLDWIGNVWNALSVSIPKFINSIGSFFNENISTNTIGNTVSNIPIGNINNNQLTIGGAYQNFDTWLYGVAGFHISGFFNAILSVIVWLLNLAKDIITWFLSLVH